MDDFTTGMHFRAGQAYGFDATCGNKVKHISEEAAGKTAASLNRRPARTHDVEPYPCFWCGDWHVGRTMTPEEVKQFSMPM